MRRWIVAPAFLLAAGSVIDPPAADAQQVKPVPESFTTADGVRLKGLFHKSPNGGKQGDAVVVLLYPPGPERDMLKGDWDGLIDKLTAAGFHVFRFDWRGHGQSTDIVDPLGDATPYNGFWTNRITGVWNQRFVRGGGGRPPKNDLRVKADIRNDDYFPVYVNDLAAVRLHLDLKNDQSEINTSSIYLVGAEDTATLGVLWLAAEWQRPAVAPMLLGGLQYKCVPQSTLAPPDPPAGADIAGAVWLSASRPADVPEAALKAWVANAPKLRAVNKMLFAYGAEDRAAERDAEAFFHRVLVAEGNRALGVSAVEQTFLYPIAKTKLGGVALLGKDEATKTETKTLEFLNAVQKDRVGNVRKNRNYVSPYYIDVTRYGLRP